MNPDPVVMTAGSPEGVVFQGQVVESVQAIYVYGGATLFVEFMFDRIQPFELLKGMIYAQTFLDFCYTFCVYISLLRAFCDCELPSPNQV